MYNIEKLVSIIVPIYNAEKYLDDCIGSILDQTYKNIELILINDGSKDESEAVCHKWKEKDSRIVYKRIINSGPATARNVGLEMAQGEYIAFVDSDDMIHPEFCYFLVQNLEKNNCDISVCAFHKFNESAEMKEKQAGENRVEIILDKQSQYERLTNIKEDVNWWLWNKLYKKEIIKGKHFIESIRISEDYRFNWMIFKNIFSLCYTKAKLYYYRNSNNSLTRNEDINRFFKIIEANEPMLRESENIGRTVYRNLLRDAMAHNLRVLEMMYLLHQYDQENYNKVCNNIRKYKKDLSQIRIELRILLYAALRSYKLYKMIYMIEIYPKIILGKGVEFKKYRKSKKYDKK